MLKELLEGLMENRKPETIFLGGLGESQQNPVTKVLLVPDGMEAKSVKSFVDEYKTKPDRRKGLINAFDIYSFSAIVNRFKSANSALFKKATIGDTKFEAELKAILNYHPASGVNTDADNNDHRATYGFPLSEELKTWLGKNKVPFNSKEFAEFLEDNIADLVVADVSKFVTEFGDTVPSFASPSKIMELSRGIDVRVDEKVVNAYRVSDGSFAIQYTVDNKDASGKPLNLPEWFALGIPVFQNGQSYQIPLRLRFRVKDGAVSWHFEMYRKNDIFNAAFDRDCNQAAADTALPLFNGTPE